MEHTPRRTGFGSRADRRAHIGHARRRGPFARVDYGDVEPITETWLAGEHHDHAPFRVCFDLRLLCDGNGRDRNGAHRLFGDASEQDPIGPTPPGRAHHDGMNIVRLDTVEDPLDG